MYYAYMQNIYSDRQFLKDYLDNKPVYGQEVVMAAGGAYGSEANVAKAVNRAKQIRFMKTDEFKECAHFRKDVEALPSLLCRKYHVDKIPAHGKKRTRLYFGFKMAALNCQKLLDYENSLVHCALKRETA